MLLHLKHLLLEATRKCNMACPHCMRGDAEELSMDYAVIDRIFEDVRQIDHLFTRHCIQCETCCYLCNSLRTFINNYKLDNNEYNEYDCTNDKITATYELAKRCDNITRCSC